MSRFNLISQNSTLSTTAQETPGTSHLTMVMTALAVARYLQDTTGTSIKNIFHTLKPIQTAQIHLAGQTITASHPLTPQAQTILNALDIDPEI